MLIKFARLTLDCSVLNRHIFCRFRNGYEAEVDFDDTVPLSSIVHADNLSDAQKAFKLFEKYIEVGCVVRVCGVFALKWEMRLCWEQDHV